MGHFADHYIGPNAAYRILREVRGSKMFQKRRFERQALRIFAHRVICFRFAELYTPGYLACKGGGATSWGDPPCRMAENSEIRLPRPNFPGDSP